MKSPRRCRFQPAEPTGSRVPAERPEGAGWPPGPGAWGRVAEPRGRAVIGRRPACGSPAPRCSLTWRAFSWLRSTYCFPPRGSLPNSVAVRWLGVLNQGGTCLSLPWAGAFQAELPVSCPCRGGFPESPAVFSTLASAYSCCLKQWLFVPNLAGLGLST